MVGDVWEKSGRRVAEGWQKGRVTNLQNHEDGEEAVRERVVVRYPAGAHSATTLLPHQTRTVEHHTEHQGARHIPCKYV